MEEIEFLLKESGLSGGLSNHMMTCGVANNTTLFLKKESAGDKTIDASYKIHMYFPDGDEEGDLTDDQGKSITTNLSGDGWALSSGDYDPVHKTRVWILQPERTLKMKQGDSVSVTFNTIKVNTVTGLSELCLYEKSILESVESQIQKLRVPETVSMDIRPATFVYGDEISVCFTIDDPGQYKSITYCGTPLDRTKSSFEQKETAKCDADYTVTITNEAGYAVTSTKNVCLHGLESYEIEKISPESVKLKLKITDANVSTSRLHEKGSGKDYLLGSSSGEYTVPAEIKEDKVFYPIVGLKGTTREEKGEETEFHMPIIKKFETAKEEITGDVEGFLSLEQVKQGRVYNVGCKIPIKKAVTFYYELKNVKECWLQVDFHKIDIDVSKDSFTAAINIIYHSGTVYAVGEYDCTVTKDVTW